MQEGVQITALETCIWQEIYRAQAAVAAAQMSGQTLSPACCNKMHDPLTDTAAHLIV